MYDTLPHLFLKILRRKVYPILFRPYEPPQTECEIDLEKSNNMIASLLLDEKPSLIARLGANELGVVVNYLHVKKNNRNILDYIKGYGAEWWWNEHSLEQLQQCAGVWPSTHDIAEKFALRTLADCREIDILGSWLPGEYFIEQELRQAQKVQLFNLEPFWANNPWTRVLEGKKVLVVHPFSDTIASQYQKKELLFPNKNIWPQFDLITYKSVQSIGGCADYENWFDALETMEREIIKLDFDIAILGCGAYGLPLAAHIKRAGKKAVHLGGVTQILFGIIGSRWEKPTSAMCCNGYYPELFNNFWCRPGDTERPLTADKVENACYW